jgi:hypothetical protein
LTAYAWFTARSTLVGKEVVKETAPE